MQKQHDFADDLLLGPAGGDPLDAFRSDFERLRNEVSKVIVGQIAILDDVLIALIAGGHVLLEGVPGLGKTLTVRTLADALVSVLGDPSVARDMGLEAGRRVRARDPLNEYELGIARLARWMAES